MEKILIVDDDSNVIRQVTEYLNELGYSPDFLLEAEYIFQKLESNLVDLILLDVNMPGVNGLTVLKDLRNHHEYKKVPVIMLTGDDSDKLLSECFETGAQDFIYKPIKELVLKSRINNTIKIIRQQNKLKKTNSYLENAYQTLEETKEKLIRSEKLGSLGVLTAGISHEINNPNNFISAGSSQLIDELTEMKLALEHIDFDDEGKEQIDMMQEKLCILLELVTLVKKGANKIDQVIKGLKCFSFINQTNNIELDFHAMLKQLVSRLDYLLEKKVEVIFELSPIPRLFCDAGVIEQVFMHILRNAVQSIKESGTIEISSKTENNFIIIKICDSGCGIHPKKLRKVFDPFYTTRDVGEGLGLGLSICHSIVEGYGGKIQIESELNKGTQVTTYIPKK